MSNTFFTETMQKLPQALKFQRKKILLPWVFWRYFGVFSTLKQAADHGSRAEDRQQFPTIIGKENAAAAAADRQGSRPDTITAHRSPQAVRSAAGQGGMIGSGSYTYSIELYRRSAV